MTAASPPPPLQQALTGYWISQSLYVVAKLGIADLLKDGPRDVTELAAATHAQVGPLYRVLRALASVGYFRSGPGPRQFELNAAAEPLRSDVPGSLRVMALMMGEEHYKAWGELLHSVRTGETGFQKVYGEPIFDYLGKHPEQAALFDAAMTGIHGRETSAMLQAFDFSKVKTLVDVGGGNGSTLAVILRQHTELQGILYDLPHVVARSEQSLAQAGLTGRCRAVGGSFFDEVPASGDIYLLRHIIHDWYDADCLRILKNVRRAIPADGRLLIVESVIMPGDDPSFGKLLDLTMLVIPGGQERTEPEYRELLEAAGFELDAILPTEAEVSVIVSRPV